MALLHYQQAQPGAKSLHQINRQARLNPHKAEAAHSTLHSCGSHRNSLGGVPVVMWTCLPAIIAPGKPTQVLSLNSTSHTSTISSFGLSDTGVSPATRPHTTLPFSGVVERLGSWKDASCSHSPEGETWLEKKQHGDEVFIWPRISHKVTGKRSLLCFHSLKLLWKYSHGAPMAPPQ